MNLEDAMLQIRTNDRLDEIEKMYNVIKHWKRDCSSITGDGLKELGRMVSLYRQYMIDHGGNPKQLRISGCNAANICNTIYRFLQGTGRNVDFP